MEDGALTTDSKGSNTLTNNGASADTGDFKQGLASADFPTGSQYLSIADGDLDSGFPLKNGDSNKSFTFCCWFKQTDNDPFNLVSKFDSNKYSFRIAGIVSTFKYFNVFFGTGSGATYDYIDVFDSEQPLLANVWFHLGFTYDDSTRKWAARLWDDTNKVVYSASGTRPSSIHVEDSALYVGIYSADGIDGNMDEVVFFNRALSFASIDLIRQGLYSGSGATATTTTTTTSTTTA